MGEREKHLRHMSSEPTEPTWPLTRWTLFFFPLRVEETETQDECTAAPGPHGTKDFEQNLTVLTFPGLLGDCPSH